MATEKFVQSFVLLTIMPSTILWLHAQSTKMSRQWLLSNWSCTV